MHFWPEDRIVRASCRPRPEELPVSRHCIMYFEILEILMVEVLRIFKRIERSRQLKPKFWYGQSKRGTNDVYE
jgi:hypothetical protein